VSQLFDVIAIATIGAAFVDDYLLNFLSIHAIRLDCFYEHLYSTEHTH
jgi:hypothetical protein